MQLQTGQRRAIHALGQVLESPAQPSRPAHEAAAAMLVFGLGTGPALLGVGVSWTWLSARGKRRLAILLGPAMITLGVFTLLR